MVKVSATKQLAAGSTSGSATAVYTISSGEGTEFVLTDITVGNAHASGNLGVFLVDTSSGSTTTVYGPIFANAQGTTAITDLKNGPRFTTGVYAYASSGPSTAITVHIGGKLE